MIYIYTYLLICCITYYQTYQQILYRFGDFDFFVQSVREALTREYGRDLIDQYKNGQIKLGLYVVLFFTSPFLIVTGVFR